LIIKKIWLLRKYLLRPCLYLTTHFDNLFYFYSVLLSLLYTRCLTGFFLTFFFLIPWKEVKAYSLYQNDTTKTSPKQIIDSSMKTATSRIDYFIPFKGKKIRTIKITTELSKFSVSDSKPRIVKWSVRTALKAAEALHADTKPDRIFDFLLIRPGEEIKPEKLVEAERLLRSNHFLDDATFVIQNETEETVDILVVTRDVFSLSPELSYFNPKKFTVGLVEANFIGTANIFGVNIHRDPEALNKTRPALRFTLNNPFGDYVSYSASYSSFGRSITSPRRSENSFVLSAERPYLTNLFRWQGGLVLGLYASYDYFNDTLFSAKYKYKYTLIDGWIGLNNYRLNLFNLLKKEWSILYTARITSKEFSQKPALIDQEYLYNVVDNLNILAQASLFRRSFYRFTHLFDLGRPEDIETGRLISMTTAYSMRNANPGWYLSAEFQMSEHLGEDRFVTLKCALGSFFDKKNPYDGKALLYMLFIPAKKDLTRTYFRNYFSIAYSHLFRQRFTAPLYGEGPYGLLDYGQPIVPGNKRLAFKYESLLFFKNEIWGFNLAPLFTSQWLYTYSDRDKTDAIHALVGAGGRIRNRRWISTAFEAKALYYPRLTGEKGFLGFNLTTTFDLRNSISLLHRPEFIEF